jgi:hypothetical protein
MGAVALAAVLGVAGTALAASWFRGPPVVARVTIENPTAYQIVVEVGSPGRKGVLDLGAVRRAGNQTHEQVVDQGAAWVFRFSYAGYDGGKLMVSRAQLSRDGWRITVPAEVGERLRTAGLAPSAF